MINIVGIFYTFINYFYPILTSLYNIYIAIML